MWIHRICDYHLTEEVFDNFEADVYKEYNCMLCRQETRKKYIERFINNAEKEDSQNRWFVDPYEQEEYKRIIKNPMYLSKMRQNLDSYLVDINLLKNHFNLIFTNAFNYNKPKDRVYKDAERIQEIVNTLLEKKWDKLIEKQDMSIEEQEHQHWVQKQIEADPDFLDKSEDVIVPPKRFSYVPTRDRKTPEPVAAAPVKSASEPSDNDSSVVNSVLRKRKPNIRYTEDDNYATYLEEAKNPTSKSVDSKSIGKKEASARNRKNPELHFSSDEEIGDIKNINIGEIDLNTNTNNGKLFLILTNV